MRPLLITLTANHTSARSMQWITRRQLSPPHCNSHGDEHLQSSNVNELEAKIPLPTPPPSGSDPPLF